MQPNTNSPTITRIPHFLYGGDYNPDQWPEEVWSEDVRLMREAGVNLVSLGIFSWSKLEPHPDGYNFGWLDRLMNMLHEHGVSVNLATPTASPPAWLVRQHPEILPVTVDGTTLWQGSRRHYCPHSPVYLEQARKVTMKLAERYARHPALAMWHVDNEYACHFGECFCDASAAAFREWLRKRYGSLEVLNQAWGTAFWSQHYSEWEEIQPPRTAPTYANPTQQLDWKRFSSDSWLACFEEQKAVLRKATPNIPVTTNFMSFHKPIDYWKFAAQEDVVSNDSYPDPSESEWMVHSGMACDLIRSLKDRCPWVLMEQAAAQVNWRGRNATKRPGMMRLGSYQAIARGADGIMFFQWRASKAGAEKHHSGMIPHAGTESRTWREVKALGNELSKLDSILSSRVQAQVAILFDWENWWALELDSKPSNDLKLLPQIYSYYKPLFDRNITVDFAHPASDLSRYKLVLMPNLYLVDDPSAANLNRYVENGGTLVMSFFSGIVDANEQIRLGGYPASFREMLGLVVEEYVPYQETQSNALRTDDGKRYRCSFWSDVIRPKTAQVLATYEQDFYADSPAITRNQFGKGKSFYIGTVPDPAGMDWLLEQACTTAGVQPVSPDAPAGAEVLQRSNGSSTWLFVLNHSAEKVAIPFEGHGQDLVTGIQVDGIVELEPADIAIIQFDRSPNR